MMILIMTLMRTVANNRTPMKRNNNNNKSNNYSNKKNSINNVNMKHTNCSSRTDIFTDFSVIRDSVEFQHFSAIHTFQV